MTPNSHRGGHKGEMAQTDFRGRGVIAVVAVVAIAVDETDVPVSTYPTEQGLSCSVQMFRFEWIWAAQHLSMLRGLSGESRKALHSDVF